MTGWSGGAANYRWQRDRRGPDDGRLALREDVARILAQFRSSHDWEPGMVWNPYRGAYEAARVRELAP